MGVQNASSASWIRIISLFSVFQACNHGMMDSGMRELHCTLKPTISLLPVYPLFLSVSIYLRKSISICCHFTPVTASYRRPSEGQNWATNDEWMQESMRQKSRLGKKLNTLKSVVVLEPWHFGGKNVEPLWALYGSISWLNCSNSSFLSVMPNVLRLDFLAWHFESLTYYLHICEAISQNNL